MNQRFVAIVIVLLAALPARAQQATPVQAAAKYQADLDAYNSLHSQTVLPDDFDDYRAGSRQWLPPGVKASGNVRFQFNMAPFDVTERQLTAAESLPGAVPELDGPASALLQSLKTLNPLLSTMTRYAATQGYDDDDFKLARENHAAVVAAVLGTLQADKHLGTALNAYATTVDRQQLAGVPAGLAHDLLADRLAIRQVQSIVSTLKANDDTAALGVAIAAMSDANAALAHTFDTLSPPAEGDCTSYLHEADEMLGSARKQLRAAKAGDDPHQPNDFFHDLYPMAMSTLDMCQKLEQRARF